MSTAFFVWFPNICSWCVRYFYLNRPLTAASYDLVKITVCVFKNCAASPWSLRLLKDRNPPHLHSRRPCIQPAHGGRHDNWPGEGSLWPLPCPDRSAGPTAWTPAFRLRPCSRSDTAPSPCRSAGTVRTPGPSLRARVLPRTRSRGRGRDRAQTSWS